MRGKQHWGVRGRDVEAFAPPGFQRFTQARAFEVIYGGGEANVAVSLAHFGCESWYVTRVPANPIGDAAVRARGAVRVAMAQDLAEADSGKPARGRRERGIIASRPGAEERRAR